jgi:nicotinamidase-related amidase
MKRKSSARTALLLIDFINPLLADGGPRFVSRALMAARRARILKGVARRARFPVIYANDHFGNWQADFPALLDECRDGNCAKELVALLEPDPQDFTVLKPRHSAFYGTPLEFLLDELQVTRLILAGIEADICVMFTAHDAYMRKFDLWVPRNCIASRSVARLDAALELMKANLKAETRPFTGRLGKSA